MINNDHLDQVKNLTLGGPCLEGRHSSSSTPGEACRLNISEKERHS